MVDAALVGLVLPGVENHSLRALRLALKSSGLDGHIVAFGGFPDLERAIADVVALRPRVCGISVQTIESAMASMVFVRLLRARGYRGTIVAGGHFATLNAEDILALDAGVDVVVRFAGEEAIIGLARGARTDEELGALPGVLWRAADGAVRRGASAITGRDALSITRADERELPEHVGFAAADLVVSRGCEAHCAYCCIAAASDLAVRESGKDARYARRSLTGIAEEIAELYAKHGARVFNFMDDNVLPMAADEIADWGRALRAELDRRRVPEIALSLQVRADGVSEASASALAALGLVRAYVGIDGYSGMQLGALGRRAPAEAGARAIALLRERGIFTVVNALLVGPTISFESVLAEVDAIGAIRGAPVHLLPIEARAGTTFFRRAERRGLIEGGFLHWHYRFEDPRTERMAKLLTSLPTRLAERSIPIALYDLGYNAGVVRRLLPEAAIDSAVSTWERVTAAWNEDQARVLRSAASVAAGACSAEALDAWIARESARTRALDRVLLGMCDDALAQVERAATIARRRPARAHARGSLLGAVAFSMSLAACSSGDEPSGGRDAGGGRDAAIMDTGTTADAAPGDDSATPGDDAGTGTDAAAPIDAGACETATTAPRVMCGSCFDEFAIRFDESGRAVEFDVGGGGMLSPDVEACLRALFAPYCYPSFAGTTQRFPSHCWIA